MTKEEKAEKQRIYRNNTRNSCTKKYEKTQMGFIMRMYRNMKSRVTGVQSLKSHLYLGKELIDKKEFYRFAYSSIEFVTLFTNWENNNYDRKLTPSIDRIDPSKGYTIDNMRFITHSENSRLGSISRNEKRKIY